MAGKFGHDVDPVMVGQVLPDARKILHDVEAVPAQMVGWTDTGQHHQLRRADGARGDDDLAVGEGGQKIAIDRIGHAGGARALECDALDLRLGHHREIWAFERGTQVAHGGGAAAGVPRGGLVDPGTFLHRPVEIGVIGNAHFLARAQEGAGHRLRIGVLDTPSGPSVPCHSPERIALPSERRKYLRMSSKPHPVAPSSTQRS